MSFSISVRTILAAASTALQMVGLSGCAGYQSPKIKVKMAGAAYKYNTYLDTKWLWFSDEGKCLGWATANGGWPEKTQRILELTDSK